MPPKSIVADDLVKALQDKSVLKIIGNLYESRLRGLTTKVVFSRSGSEVIVVALIVSGTNPILVCTSSDLL